MKIDTFQLGSDGNGIAQIQALFSNDTSQCLIDALCNLGFCYGSVVMCIDISNDDGIAYLVAQSPAAEWPADLEWVCNSLNRFEPGWAIDVSGKLYSPANSSLSAIQVREVLLASKQAAMPLPLATVA